MLRITNTAYTRLSELLSNHPTDVAMRIVRRAGRSKLKRGSQQPGDEAFQHAGRTVLLLDQKAAKRLARKTLVVNDTDGGPKLRLCRIAPNSSS